MRILFIHNRYRHPGGAERMVESEAALLREAGHDVTVYGVDSGEISRLPRLRRLVRYAQVPYSFSERRRLHSHLSANPADLIHFHNLTPFLSASVLDALPDDLPRVMTLDNFKPFCVNHVFLRDGKPCELCPNGHPLAGIVHRCHEGSLVSSTALTVAQWTGRHLVGLPHRIDRFVCPSAFLKDRYGRYGWPVERLVEVPNFAPDPGEPEKAQRTGPPMYLGRLAGEKGIRILLDALAIRPRPFTIAGDGPLRDIVQAHASMHRGVEWTGWLDGPQIAQRLATAKCLVVPSTCYENQPVAALEAMARGAPVIATSGGALPELVEDGVNGILVPAGDAGALAAALDRMESISGPDRAGMGAASRARYLARHTPAGHRDALLLLYREAARARSGSGPNAG